MDDFVPIVDKVQILKKSIFTTCGMIFNMDYSILTKGSYIQQKNFSPDQAIPSGNF